NLNPRTLQQLLAVHLALDSRAQRFIPEDELRALAASLSELREAVVSSGMPDDLKSAFEQRVAALQAAVSHYRVFGYDGLKEAITLLMGEVFVDTDTKVRQQHNTVFSRVRESMTSAATVLNAASQGATASNVIVKEGVGFVRNMVGLLTGHNILGP
ncbi:MAG TPA: hypothetical protein VHA07_03070, partial [Devosia sp.]|nr:hypothetical protein [Devosia sp.]